MTTCNLARFGAALGFVAFLTLPAHAFSQIGTKDGAAPQRDGIVSVPLPPLAGTATPGTATGATPAAAPSEPPAAPGAPVPDGTTPAAPTGAAPSAEPVEKPATEPDAPPPGDDGDAPSGAAEPNPANVPAGAISKSTEDEEAGPPAVVVYGEEGLPQAVRDLREKLMAVAKTGDIEGLRPYLQLGEEGTLLSFGEAEGDPIAFLKSASGDGEGVEVLAIMLEVLEAGHVRNEPDSDNEIFVWPYFTAVAVDKLTKPQKVELFELVTAGDYQEMLGFGAYNFYRMGISPDGKLQFFVAGD